MNIKAEVFKQTLLGNAKIVLGEDFTSPETIKERSGRLLSLAKEGLYVTPNHRDGVPDHDFSEVPDEGSL